MALGTVLSLESISSSMRKKSAYGPRYVGDIPVFYLVFLVMPVACEIRCCPIWIVVVASNLVFQVASQRGSTGMSHCRVSLNNINQNQNQRYLTNFDKKEKLTFG
jgi:hypothetical protein